MSAHSTVVRSLRRPDVRRRLALTAALLGCFLWAMVIMGLAFAFVERGAAQWWLVLVFGALVLLVAAGVGYAFRRTRAAVTAPAPRSVAVQASLSVDDAPAAAPALRSADAVRAAVAVEPAGVDGLPIEPLSVREREVLAQLAAGRSNREIAAALHVAPGTVKAHLNHIFRKLGASTRLQAVAHAHEAGLLDRK